MESKTLPRYIEIEGIRLSDVYLEEAVQYAMRFKPSDDDIVVVTYPKCGTTWMCQIVKLILEKGENLEMSSEEYFKTFSYIDFYGEDGVRGRSKTGCIKTHLPFERINFSEKAKYIYVTRHPRDCVVSFYHHTRYFQIYRFTNGKFDDFFDLFVKGKVDYNDYFDHLLSWYEQRHRPNILFLTYESIKADNRETILKVADFLGCELADKQVDNVLKYSSFAYMKKETNACISSLVKPKEISEGNEHYNSCLKGALQDGHKSIGSFFRKGVVGEGKVVLSEEQEARLKARIAEKTRGSDVMSLWSED